MNREIQLSEETEEILRKYTSEECDDCSEQALYEMVVPKTDYKLKYKVVYTCCFKHLSEIIEKYWTEGSSIKKQEKK